MSESNTPSVAVDGDESPKIFVNLHRTTSPSHKHTSPNDRRKLSPLHKLNLNMAYEVPEALIQRKSPREQLREKNSRQIQRSLRELQHETHFGKLEIEDLYAKYVTKLGQGNQMTPDIFKSAIAELMDVDITENEELVERYYKFFDTDSNGNVSFVEFVTGASVLLKGTALEKIKLIFSCYDLDNDGYLTASEMKHWLTILYTKTTGLLNECCTVLSIPHDNNGFEKTDELINKIVIACFDQADIDKDGRLTFEEFSNWAQRQPEIQSLLAPSLTTPHSPRTPVSPSAE